MNSYNPTVSIIIPTYNRAEYIQEAIRSIFEQSFQDFEIIIIDDGSTDNTRKILEDWNETRIKYFYYEHIGRLATLRNKGIALSKGTYIAFLDSDDLWNSNKLESQIKKLNENKDINFSFTDVEEFNQHRILKNSIYSNYPFYQKEYIGYFLDYIINNNMIIYPSTLLFRKEILSTIGLLDDINFKSSDTAFIIKIITLYKGYIPFTSLVKIRKHEENMSSVFEYQIIAINEIIFCINELARENKVDKKKHTDIISKYKYQLANVFINEKLFSKARKELKEVIQLNPFFIKGWIKYLLIYFKKSCISL